MKPRAVACLASLTLCAAGVCAQTPGEFYKGRNVELYIGYSVGGGYDLYARTIARHIGRHIPGNPVVLAKNMEGAGSLRLANWLYNVAPKDGSAFGTITRGAASDPLLGQPGAQYDASKFTWIGSANNEVSVCVAWHTAAISKFEDLLAKDMTVGSTGTGDDTYQFGKVLAGLMGARLKIVTGYPGGNDVVLAMERGEVQGRCGWSWSSVKSTHQRWIDQKKITVLVQFALAKHPDLPDVPLVTDLAKNDEQRQELRLIFARQVMGRPYLAPPGIPKDRTEALRQAFMDTMNDAAFLTDAERAKLEIRPTSGEELERLVDDIAKTPADVARRAAELIR